MTETMLTPSRVLGIAVVDAAKGWQDVDMFVNVGDRVNIQYVSGQWTHWVDQLPYSDASGKYGYICADAIPSDQCVEPIPDFPTGALIGKIGGKNIKIGNATTFVSDTAGFLLLRINDADVGLYDNAGSITVEIIVEGAAGQPGFISPTRTPQPEIESTQEQTIVKVYMLIFDPEINSNPLTQHSGFSDPRSLTEAFIQDVSYVTGDTVTYQIVRESIIRGFPAKMGGFTYTSDQYWECINSSATNAPEYCHRSVDYSSIVNTHYDPNYVTICEAIASGEVDEVWEWEGGWLGFLEFKTISPGSICPNIERDFTLMTFNYSRGVAEMLHSLGHRVENELLTSLGEQMWNDFDGQMSRYSQNYDQPKFPDTQHPEVDAQNTHCGNVHFPPNAYLHYQYDRDYPVQSDCDRWLTYPDLADDKITLNCEVWDCTQYGFLKWWLYHIPHNPGSTNGIHHNWWKYVYSFANQ